MSDGNGLKVDGNWLCVVIYYHVNILGLGEMFSVGRKTGFFYSQYIDRLWILIWF